MLTLLGTHPAPLVAQQPGLTATQPAAGRPSSGVPFPARFVDVAQEAGLHAPVIYGGTDRKDYILETVGSGAAFFDYDNDGWADIFLLTGVRLEETPANTSNRLYRNNRDGTFTDVTRKAGLEHSGWASSVAVGDYDNDGNEDLFLTYWGPNALYRNNGDGTFTDMTGKAGLLEAGKRWSSGCTFLDYDRDGHLDLFVARYMEFVLDRQPGRARETKCNWKGVPVNCGSDGLPAETHSLYRNHGDGTFRDVSRASGIASAERNYGMTAVSADFNNDGWPDIYVAGDETLSLLFLNQRDGTFREEGLERGAAVSADGKEQAGMGIGVGDYDLDGDLDIFKTHFADDTNVLYRNDGAGHFEDMTLKSGLAVETRFVGWGAGIVDLDNDGRPDLFYATGNVYPELEKERGGSPYRTPRVIFRNLGGGQFDEWIEGAGPGIAALHDSRGAAFGDFDNDGDLDVLIVNINESPSLLRNDLGGENHWLQVRLSGAKSNRSAIGARVTARYGGRQQVQEVLSQSSYYSSNDRRLHFGVGQAVEVDLEVRWPSGRRQQFAGVAADRLVRIDEERGME